MPSRRTFIAACSLLGTAGVPRGAAEPTAREPTATANTATGRLGVDPNDTVDVFRHVGDRVFGRVDLRAARRLRDSAPTLDRSTGFDRRLAPLLGHGRDAPAGLRSLSGDLDPHAVLRRLRRRATVDRRGAVGDHALYAASTASGRATVGTDGTDVVVDGGDAAAATTIAGEDGEGAGLTPAAAAVVEGLRDAEAFTGATVAPDAAEAFDRGDPARAVLPAVTAFGLGVDADGDRPVLRARIVATGDEPLSGAAVRTLLRAAGVPDDLLADASTRSNGRVVDVHAPLPRREETRPAVALLFLVVAIAVIGTFVLGLGSPPGESRGATGRSNQRPQVALGFDTRPDGRVRITHHGGDTLESAVAIRYTSDGRRVTERWRATDGIAAGDSYTTEEPVDGGTILTVVRQGENDAVVLARFQA